MNFFSFGQYAEWDEQRAICLCCVNSVIVPVWNSSPKRRLKLNSFLTCAYQISCLTSFRKLLNEKLPQRSTLNYERFYLSFVKSPSSLFWSRKPCIQKINLILQAKMTITLINNLLFKQRKMNFSQLINCFRTWAHFLAWLSKFHSQNN